MSEFFLELLSEEIPSTLQKNARDTLLKLFKESFEKTKEHVSSPDIMQEYIEGKLGYNELLTNRERLFSNFDDSCDLVFKSLEGTLIQKNLLTQKIKNYLDELKIFVLQGDP